MATETYKKGSVIYKAGDKMKSVGLIVKGSVQQRGVMDRLTLETGHLLGLAGCDGCVYLCDYIAKEDTTISTFEYRKPEDFVTIFENSEEYGNVFILAALKQTSVILEHYIRIRNNARSLHQLILSMHRDYKYLCSKFSVAEHELSRMEHLTPVDMEHSIPAWKEQYYKKFVTFGIDELKGLFTSRELCVGTIEQAGGFMAEMLRRIEELLSYIEKTKPVLFNDKKDDLFQLLFDLESRVSFVSQEKEELQEKIKTVRQFITKSGLYEAQLVESRMTEYDNFVFATCQEELSQTQTVWGQEEQEQEESANMQDDDTITCLENILRFADYNKEEIVEFDSKLKEYKNLPDPTATDGEARTLRKWLSTQYYRCYKICAKKTLEQGGCSPIVNLFLNFGFMDVSYAGGEEYANRLLELSDRLFTCNTNNVHTFLDWIKSIYQGENEPSINELDMDFNKYVTESVRNGDIPSDQEAAYRNDPWSKVEFELDNLFVSGGKLTCGHITTFCPILSENDLLSDPGNMLVTAMRVMEAIDMVRSVDFRLFYREVMFSDEEHGIQREFIQQEILPYFILMPNVGSKGMMWQPTSGARNNTPARFMLPILASADLTDMIVENCGRYRWEICRKIQGSRWNDITTPSLTSEYSDYLQYFRKNFDLSPDAKEKLHNSIKRARNNYREVFVYDYENWIKYEAKGSFRLNKVARNILFTYCPFGGQIRETLKDNPTYQESFKRFDNLNQKSLKRLTALYRKYTDNGGEITPNLEENMNYYEM